MTEGNNHLSPTASAAVKRIRILREASRKTGFATTTEQATVLTNLSDADILTVSDELARDLKAIRGAR